MGDKKEPGKSHPNNVYKSYSDGKSKNKACPKCGTGTFLAQHKDRTHCGKCGYTEFTKKEN